MDLPAFLILAIALVNLFLWVWVISRLVRKEAPDTLSRVDSAVQLLKAELIAKQAESMLALRGSIDAANRIVNERLAEGTSSLDKRMSVFGEIENKLGQLSEKADSIESVGRNIQSLSELLRPPTSRGKVGEFLLENLLQQILPPALYERQYRFADGLRVDAVIKLGSRLMPVDAKFPLEAYQRLSAQPDDSTARKEFAAAIRKQTDSIAGKYIKQDHETTDFAIMYIPAEAVYYQLIAGEDSSAFEYALSKNVIPSSPGHLYGFLASVAAVYSEIDLARSSVEKGTRWLATGIYELEETSTRLDRLHDRMEGSLRSLSASLDKSRAELRHVRLQLEKLREPAVTNEKAVDN